MRNHYSTSLKDAPFDSNKNHEESFAAYEDDGIPDVELIQSQISQS